MCVLHAYKASDTETAEYWTSKALSLNGINNIYPAEVPQNSHDINARSVPDPG